MVKITRELTNMKTPLSIAVTKANYERWGHKFKHFTISKKKTSFCYRGKKYKFDSAEVAFDFIREQLK